MAWQESSVFPQTVSNPTGHAMQQSLEEQLATQQAMDESHNKLMETISRLVKRLDCLVQEQTADNSEERRRLQEDIQVSMQCLETCKVATAMTRQKTYRVGETSAEDNSDLVIVNTLSNLFDVGAAKSTNNSAHLVASLTSEDFREVVAARYNSRFGTVLPNRSSAEAGAARPPPTTEARLTRAPAQAAFEVPQNAEQKSSRQRPSPNEIRRRSTIGEGDE